MSRNHRIFGIFCDRTPVDESKPSLLIVSVKTDLDAVTIGLLWNFKCCRRAKLELQLEALAIESRRFVRQQIWNADQQTGNAADNQKRPTLCNQKSSKSLPPNQDGRNDSNYQARQNSKRYAQKEDGHAPLSFHFGHMRESR